MLVDPRSRAEVASTLEILLTDSELRDDLAHRARIWGVYVTARARGRGFGGALVARLMETARGWPGVTSVGLAASERSEEAQRLYQSLGFRVWGREPGASLVEGRLYDEIHMVAMLRG